MSIISFDSTILITECSVYIFKSTILFFSIVYTKKINSIEVLSFSVILVKSLVIIDSQRRVENIFLYFILNFMEWQKKSGLVEMISSKACKLINFERIKNTRKGMWIMQDVIEKRTMNTASILSSSEQKITVSENKKLTIRAWNPEVIFVRIMTMILK